MDERPPESDYWTPLLSVPRILRTRLDNIPADVPYLFADPALAAHWKQQLEPRAGYRIGIHWKARAGVGLHRQRDIPLDQFRSLANLPGVQLISLQKGGGKQDLVAVGSEIPVIDLGTDIDEASGSFMDTAAIITNLDLVITCDTSIAHLAGALAAPVWVALPSSPDWRWMLDRSDSPWYPTMRLFRQKRSGDWDSVFAEIKSALESLLPA